MGVSIRITSPDADDKGFPMLHVFAAPDRHGVPNHRPELDGSTWLTRARRSLAELPMGEAAHAGWNARQADRQPCADPVGVLHRLDTLVSDLDGGRARVHEAYDMRNVDRGLGCAFQSARSHQRAGRGIEAIKAGRDALDILCRLSHAGAGDVAAICASVQIDHERSEHLRGVLMGSYERCPSGTVAYALGTLEGLAYRLVRSGRVGSDVRPVTGLGDVVRMCGLPQSTGRA